MTQKLVECIPNFSEGRRLEVVDAIEAAIAAVDGVHVLDRTSDADHNRSVITFIGVPDSVEEAAFAAITKAAELIDLDVHEGEHPRLGATDVVPFVPIAGVTMDDCIEMSHRVGRRVGDELGIPVYLYEAAATRPERQNLADVRRGQYEGLKESITTPERQPDFGPAKVGKAGATIIGARAPLVAYNVYLTTDDVSIAKKIAKAVRHSSGGLAYVKGLGMLVEGRAQVSMNLTDYTRTPIARVVEMIRREAARYGVGIHSSELIGLIPQQALVDAAQWYLQLDGFEPDQILESQVFRTMSSAGQSEDSAFLDQLAAGTATPGGGSAAGYAGAMAAALAAMVARLTIGKKKYVDVEQRMQEIAAEADELRASLQESVQLDAQAFDAVMAAYRLPKATDAEKTVRAAAIESATHGASEVPLNVARQVVQVLELLVEVAEQGNTNALTDAASGAAMARAALQSAGMNVKINTQSVSDPNAAKGWLDTLSHLEAQSLQADDRIRTALLERAGLS